jgi:deoxyribodipyrimidine photo-lyase
LAEAAAVIPVFVLDSALLTTFAASEKRLAFLFAGLRMLDADLRGRGARLIVRQGEPAAELARLVRETGAEVVFAEENVSPYARRRDARVAAVVPLRLLPGLTVRPPDLVRKADGGVYTVFTPFSRAWKALPPPQAADLLAAPEVFAALPDLSSLPIPDEPALPPSVPFPPGEAEAQRRLRTFADMAVGARGRARLHAYANDRDRVDLDGTSQLSPYLRFGMISPRQCVAVALEAAAAATDEVARQGAETWLNELIWREFYTAILHHFPDVLREEFQPGLRGIAWANDRAQFAAWCEGRTGCPIVDAAMRQLVQTGWMHNRARMISASFLVKDLLIDWRWGERFFMAHLIDGDPAANNGGWQWTAGVGTDAAPYFRVFNPSLQSARFDPEGTYIRRWAPELARVPARFIHEPWKMPSDVQRQAGCIVGSDYPPPIVDHAAARERALAAYRRTTP